VIESSIDLKAAANQGRLSYLDQGPNPATLYVFGGTRAASIGTPAGEAPLCIITLSTPAGTVDGMTGALSLAQLEDGLILAGGAATWCRAFNGDGAACFDMDAGAAGSGAEAILTTTTLYAGGLLRLLSCNLG
jgi:hypothetical protein